MKLKFNNRIYPTPSEAVVMAAIGKCDDVAILENGSWFIQCRQDDPDQFFVEYIDGDACKHFEPAQGKLTRNQVASLFVSFCKDDKQYLSLIEWQPADYQPADEDILLTAESYEDPELAAMRQQLEDLKHGPDLTLAEAEESLRRTEVILAESAECEKLTALLMENIGQPISSEPAPMQFVPSAPPGFSGRSLNPQLVCPHCAVRGMVHTKQGSRKVGISGGKATGALLTAGLSLFAVGLSRKEKVTEACCANCNISWQF